MVGCSVDFKDRRRKHPFLEFFVLGAKTPVAASVSLRDRAEAEAYMKKHCIRGLMLELTESVMLYRPEHPEQFLQEVLAFLPCGVVPLVVTFDTSACDAFVFAVRCRATRACVRCVLLAMPGAGLLGRGRGRAAHVVGGRRGQARLARCVRRASSRGRGRAARSSWGTGRAGTVCVRAAGGGARRQAGAYIVRPLNSWPSRGA